MMPESMAGVPSTPRRLSVELCCLAPVRRAFAFGSYHRKAALSLSAKVGPFGHRLRTAAFRSTCPFALLRAGTAFKRSVSVPPSIEFDPELFAQIATLRGGGTERSRPGDSRAKRDGGVEGSLPAPGWPRGRLAPGPSSQGT